VKEFLLSKSVPKFWQSMARGFCSFALVVAAVSNCSAGLELSFDSQSPVISGNAPGSTGVYATVLFDRVSNNQVDATFTVTNTVGGLFVGEIGFQFNAAGVTFTRLSGVTATTSFNANGIAVVGTGNQKFNTNFDFPQSNNARLKFGQPSKYRLTFTGLNLSNDLSNLFATPTGNKFDYISAAHIQGYGDSAGIAPSGGNGTGEGPGEITAVPEPTSLGIAGIAFGAFAIRRWKQKRKLAAQV
jgi:hypothetical protein